MSTGDEHESAKVDSLFPAGQETEETVKLEGTEEWMTTETIDGLILASARLPSGRSFRSSTRCRSSWQVGARRTLESRVCFATMWRAGALPPITYLTSAIAASLFCLSTRLIPSVRMCGGEPRSTRSVPEAVRRSSCESRRTQKIPSSTISQQNALGSIERRLQAGGLRVGEMSVEVRTPPQIAATVQNVGPAKSLISHEISDSSGVDIHVYTVDVIGSSPVGLT